MWNGRKPEIVFKIKPEIKQTALNELNDTKQEKNTQNMAENTNIPEAKSSVSRSTV